MITIISNTLTSQDIYALTKHGCTIKEVKILEHVHWTDEKQELTRYVITLPKKTKLVQGSMIAKYYTWMEDPVSRVYEYEGSYQKDIYFFDGLEVHHTHGTSPNTGVYYDSNERSIIIPLSYNQLWWNDRPLHNTDPIWKEDLYYLGNVPTPEPEHVCNEGCEAFGCLEEAF
jgi:hypothetical protein